MFYFVSIEDGSHYFHFRYTTVIVFDYFVWKEWGGVGRSVVQSRSVT